MNKKIKPVLSVIIPHYKEPQEMLDHLLTSIDLQRGFNRDDIEIIVVDDYNHKTVNKRKDIRYLTAKADCGSGMARQKGIDNSNGDYLMFIDADDQLYGSLSILHILNATNKKPDVIYGKFLQETTTIANNTVYIIMEKKDTWIHGKAYRKSYIDSIGVRFPKDIKYNEDAGWNLECLNKTKNVHKIDEFISIWNNNSNSITRLNRIPSKRKNVIDYVKVLKLATRRLLDNQAVGCVVVNTVYYLYFVLQQQFWKGNLEQKKECEKQVAEYYQEFVEQFGSLGEEDLALLYNDRRKDITDDDIYFREKETFEKFIERISQTI